MKISVSQWLSKVQFQEENLINRENIDGIQNFKSQRILLEHECPMKSQTVQNPSVLIQQLSSKKELLTTASAAKRTRKENGEELDAKECKPESLPSEREEDR